MRFAIYLSTVGLLLALVVVDGLADEPVKTEVEPTASAAVSGVADGVRVNGSDGEPTAEELKQAAQLVEQLGDRSFTVRDKAATQLTAMGFMAHAPLLAGLKHGDANVRRQSRWLLEGVFDADFRRRLARFEQDAGDKDHELPCWKRFCATVDSDPASRQIYINMLKEESLLLETVAAGGNAAAEAVNLRTIQMARSILGDPSTGRPKSAKQPTLSGVASLLFAMTDPAAADSRRLVWEHAFVAHELGQGPLGAAVLEGKVPAYRRLVGLWLKGPVPFYLGVSRLQVAVKFGIPEGAMLARQLIKDKEMAGNPGYFPLAIQAMAVLGGKEYLGALIETLSDATELSRPDENRKTATCQVRDIALAWSLYLVAEDLGEYGMGKVKPEFDRYRKNTKRIVNEPASIFASDEARDAALAKWRKYVAAHPLPELLKPDEALVIAQPAASSQSGPKAADDQPRDERPAALSLPALCLPTADSLKVGALQAVPQLCAENRFAEVVRSLDALLSAEERCVFRPSAQWPLYECVQVEAERALRALPPEGLAAYRTHYDAIARAAMQRAIHQHGIEGMLAVADRFFLTESGAAANYLAAAHYSDRGEWMRAALRFERVRTSPSADAFEPALSLRLAVCLLQAGMRDEAEKVMRSLANRQTRLPLKVAGRERDWFAGPEEAMRWSESLAGAEPRKSTANEWLVFAGDAQRNRSVSVDAPCLRFTPLASIVDVVPLRECVERESKEAREKVVAVLPRLSPLVVGSTIVMRSATHLRAYEFGSGRLLWQTGLEDSLQRFLRAKEGDAEALRSKTVARGIKRRLWSGTRFGALSSDGRSVFGVEDIPFGFGAEFQIPTVGPDGRRRLDADSARQTNLLTSHDVATGKLNWELGGAIGAGLPLAGSRFLGPPLPLGNRLFVCVKAGSETRLCELDARSGAQLGSTLLRSDEADESEIEGTTFIDSLERQIDSAETLGQTGPAYADGIMVCQVGRNDFVGVDLARRTLQWTYLSSEKQGGPNPWTIALGLAKHDEKAANKQWSDNSMTIAEGRVVLTPCNSSELVCLNLASGRPEWAVQQFDGLYVGGIRDGRVLVVGRGWVSALNLADGKPAWPTATLRLPASAQPSGRGLMAGSLYYLPLSSGDVLSINLASGQVAGTLKAVDGPVAGNLIAAHGAMLSQNAETLCRVDTPPH